MSLPDWLQSTWTLLVPLVHFSGAVAVTLHVILQSRQSRAAVAWIGMSWLAPIIGSVAYLCLGINRIERKGEALGFAELRRQLTAPHPADHDLLRAKEIVAKHPSLPGLAQLGQRVTDRKLLLGNAVTPLANGDEAYPAMLEAIRKASESVALLSYIFDSDRVGEQFLVALREAHRRGVEVRVLIDHVGSRYSKPNMVQRLKQEGVPVAAFLPTGSAGMFRFANLRNHRKILVVDGQTGFTGGTNIREGHSLDLKPDFPVQCLHFQIEGPVVAHLMEAFATDWAFTTKERLEGPLWFRSGERRGEVAARGISDGPDADLDKMAEILLGGIAAANSHIRIVTPYFLPDEVIRWALAVAAMRNVKVDIVIPGKNNIAIMDWATTPQLAFLIERGCHIYRSPEPFDHTKLMLVDGIWSLIGSTNWDARSLRLNFEYNIECYDDSLARELEEIVDEKIAGASPVTLDELRTRTGPVRLRDGLAQLLSPYL